MDRLPSDLLLKIAEMSPKARQTACRLRLINKRTHELISELRLTLFVAQRLRRKNSALHEQSRIDAVIEECAKKNREGTEDASKPFSYRQEQALLVAIARQMWVTKMISVDLGDRRMWEPPLQRQLSGLKLVAEPKSRSCVNTCTLT